MVYLNSNKPEENGTNFLSQILVLSELEERWAFELTSLNVESETVEMLILRSLVKYSLCGLEEIAGDNVPFEFKRRNGDEKSSRNVIKWFDVMINVHPSVLWCS